MVLKRKIYSQNGKMEILKSAQKKENALFGKIFLRNRLVNYKKKN